MVKCNGFQTGGMVPARLDACKRGNGGAATPAAEGFAKSGSGGAGALGGIPVFFDGGHDQPQPVRTKPDGQ